MLSAYHPLIFNPVLLAFVQPDAKAQRVHPGDAALVLGAEHEDPEVRPAQGPWFNLKHSISFKFNPFCFILFVFWGGTCAR